MRRQSRVALGVALFLVTPTAHTRARGIAVDSCSGCHGNPDAAAPMLSLRPKVESFAPGDTVTFTLEVRAAALSVAGAFITSSNVGTLRAGSGLSTQGQGLAHSAPKPAVGGVVSFEFNWQAPSTPGAVHFSIAALAGNGNGASSGDSPAYGEFDWTFGCEAAPSYVDLDRDGYGSKFLGGRLRCAGEPPPPGFAALDGDCDENDERVHPGGNEVCNKKDDDCNGMVDEGAAPVSLWPDADGDGFYSRQTGEAKVGCGDVRGYAATGGDCDDRDPTIHPRAVEVCNARDDNCDGDVDERVRPQCGLGWCSRYSSTCSVADCRPGEPREETCNAFDDDCDGELDNGVCSDSDGSSAGGSSTGGSTAGAQGGGTGGAGAGTQPSAAAGGTDGKASSAGCAAVGRSGSSPLSWLVVASAFVAANRWRRERHDRS